jgi:hypothetical protein
MSAAPAIRVNYFDRQHIRLAELRDEQAYHVQMRRRHNLSHHSWGIVSGLELVARPDGQVGVTPGLAIDGYGRELLLLDYRVIGRADFDRYATSRLDLWLEYQLELSDDRLAPVECGAADPRRKYRATELAQLVFTRGAARPDPAHPPGVPSEAFEPPALDTPDDPRRRWPVYLGRIVMELPASGPPVFHRDVADRVFVGLTAAVIDHPGNAARIELGHHPSAEESRAFGDTTVSYSAGPDRSFAVFVPPNDEPAIGAPALEPTIAIEDDGTQILGNTTVHGNLVLDGTSLQFPGAIPQGQSPDTGGHPAMYRIKAAGGDELRIDVGSLNDGDRTLVLGVTKDGQFNPALEVSFPVSSGTPRPLVRILGDVRIEGTITCDDVRTRTVTEEVAALLTGMVQAGIAAG